MAVTAACIGSLLPRASWCLRGCMSSSVKGLGELGLEQLVASARAVKSGRTNCQTRLCRAVPSSSSSSQRHVIITGGTTGIGKATATELARQGMAVTIACRSMEKGEQAVADIVRASKSSSVRVMQLDLASFASIRQFVVEYLDLGLPLNSLVNNAGVMACPQQYTVDGFEFQFGVNHLGHFLLTALLLDKLKSCALPGMKSRVVVLASAAERIGNLDFDDLNYRTRKYNEWLAYGQSKLANCLFSLELARRCTSLGIPVTSNCMHPGIVDTELIRYVFPQAVYTRIPMLEGLRPGLIRLLGLKTPEQGASTVVYLANSPDMEGITGGYYEDCRKSNPSARAVNSELSYSLWTVSEELTGGKWSCEDRDKTESFVEVVLVRLASIAANTAAGAWDLHRCTRCCSCGLLASTPACSSFELSDEAFLAAGLQKFTLRKRLGRGKLQRAPAVTRSLYSPLVESFGSAHRDSTYDPNSLSKINDSGAWNVTSATTTLAQHHEQSGAVAYKMEEEDKTSQLAPQDQLAAAYGDVAPVEKLADFGHDIEMKRSARARPPTMSLSGGFSSSEGRSVSHTVGAVGRSVNTTTLPGPMDFAMAFVVAALGLKTEKVCENCDGYGVQRCFVCQGRGVLTWEGKLRFTGHCPLSFESCFKKCSSCGEVKMK